jgi:branched-chain amino acid aminotransferase
MLRLNGAAYPSGVAPFDLADRGLTLGDGLFETIAVFGGRPALLGAHLDRMQAAAAEIRLPLDRAMLEAEVGALCEGDGDSVIRLTVTRGAGARGLGIAEQCEPTVMASRSPRPPGPLGAPIRLATASVRRNPTSFLSRAKTLSYLDDVIAFDAARRAGADDALMLNTEGRVASTAMANLFALIGDTLVTPPVAEGVLPGIIRGLVLASCEAHGVRGEERPLTTQELLAADAVFATNSVRLVMRVSEIDGRAWTEGRPGVVARIASAVASACGAAA